jgi:hypothetical protein
MLYPAKNLIRILLWKFYGQKKNVDWYVMMLCLSIGNLLQILNVRNNCLEYYLFIALFVKTLKGKLLNENFLSIRKSSCWLDLIKSNNQL